ncbi:hypothetical protein MUP01_03150 [Candidatus Bathyarchaeota archaeon]|nr:hypothetical protein [Candidatus Bathyarchaeota archaeon]
MSDVLEFNSKNIKAWLERETGSLFIPIHSKSQKLLDSMRKSLEDLSDVSKMLLEDSGKEIEKRNMRVYGRARALNKLARLFVDRTKLIRIPDKVTYDNLNGFVQETQRAFFVTETDVKNFFPRVSPFFILDRRKFQAVFEKARESLRELNGFLTREYVKTKTLEETFQIIGELQVLEEQAVVQKEQKTTSESEKAKIEREIAETEQRMASLKNKGTLSLLNQMNMEIDALSVEIKHSLQHLQKPFIKLQSLALHGEGSGLTLEEINKLGKYLEDPFDAFATEEAGYPLLKQILEKMREAISEDKLKLKPEKTRKAEQVLESILNQNSLASLHQKSVDVSMRRKQLSSSIEVAEIEKDLLKLREQVEALERRKRIVEGEQITRERAYSETVEKIRNHKTEIEKNVFNFMNKKIRVG